MRRHNSICNLCNINSKHYLQSIQNTQWVISLAIGTNRYGVCYSVLKARHPINPAQLCCVGRTRKRSTAWRQTHSSAVWGGHASEAQRGDRRTALLCGDWTRKRSEAW